MRVGCPSNHLSCTSCRPLDKARLHKPPPPAIVCCSYPALCCARRLSSPASIGLPCWTSSPYLACNSSLLAYPAHHDGFAQSGRHPAHRLSPRPLRAFGVAMAAQQGSETLAFQTMALIQLLSSLFRQLQHLWDEWLVSAVMQPASCCTPCYNTAQLLLL